MSSHPISCNLSQLFRLKSPQFIIIDNCHRIPIQGYGHAYTQPPHPFFSLNNVLYAPHIIKNLISIRKFTRNNFVSVDFDLFSFTVKDLHTGTPLTRCNSTGDLYPITLSSAASSRSHTALVAMSPSISHNRL
ncbi:hypothetical protein RND71_042958 [Anisodus tanguticus]|uniref:Uncharacterized protein n=1 Tax=Anisodus tanguticus TaxID=243964 RepID=A0AAE1USS7_9SOLA|nr:hypothetical protein RND71_042958 [Anisodus tanguticus]